MSAWRSVKSAPRDGTIVRLKQESPGAYQGLEQVAGWGKRLGCWIGTPVGFAPTHWMPRPDAAATAPDPDVLETLRALVEQLKGSGYRDELGHPIEMNVAYLDAVALLELNPPKRD